MSQEEQSIPKTTRKKAARPKHLPAPADFNPPVARPTPTDRLAEMTRSMIDCLEADKDRSIRNAERLQAELRRLEPENARLREALGNAVANNILSFVLITIGGGAMGFAPFLGRFEVFTAIAGATSVGAGILVLVMSTVRGRTTMSQVDVETLEDRDNPIHSA